MHIRSTLVSLAVLSLFAACEFSGQEPAPTRTYQQLELRDEQRAFWVDQATWSQTYAISRLNNLGDREVQYQRLLEGMGIYIDTFTPLYGAQAERSVSRLFRQQVFFTARAIDAVQAEDAAALDSVRGRWLENIDQLVSTLVELNPKFDDA